MTTDEQRAQRWHDTDHGFAIGPPLRDTRFRIPIEAPEPDWVSPCWCCCERCQPEWNPVTPNPFWTRAMAEAPGR